MFLTNKPYSFLLPDIVDCSKRVEIWQKDKTNFSPNYWTELFWADYMKYGSNLLGHRNLTFASIITSKLGILEPSVSVKDKLDRLCNLIVKPSYRGLLTYSSEFGEVLGYYSLIGFSPDNKYLRFAIPYFADFSSEEEVKSHFYILSYLISKIYGQSDLGIYFWIDNNLETKIQTFPVNKQSLELGKDLLMLGLKHWQLRKKVPNLLSCERCKIKKCI